MARRHRIQAAALATAMLTSSACSRGVLIAEYPVNAGVEARADQHQKSLDGQYWSAYVRIENLDVPRLWGTSRLDYAIISMEVSLPTRDGPIVRTLPLFTLEKGTVQVESGADLLRKTPIMTEARDQVTFQIRVTYLKNKVALDHAMKILDQARSLAEPFLSSYPLASQIIDSSVDLIDETVETSDDPASSTKWFVDPRTLSYDELQVFFLVPLDLGPKRKKEKEKKVDCEDASVLDASCDVGGWISKQIGDNQSIAECDDMPGRLCVVNTLELVQKERMDQLLDALVETAQFSAEPRETIEAIIGHAEIPLSPEVEAQLQTQLERYEELKLRACAEVQARDAEDEDAEQVGSEDERAACLARWPDELRARHDSRAAFEAWRAFQVLEELTGDVIKDSRELEARVKALDDGYRGTRLKDIVYITIDFQPSPEVWDPKALIPGLAVNCQGINDESIDTAQEYFGANVDFYTETDGNRIRGILRMARDYVRLRDFVERKTHAEALRVLDQFDILRRKNNDLDEQGGTSSSQLHAAAEHIAECFDDLSAEFPLRQHRALKQLRVGYEPWMGCGYDLGVDRLDHASRLLRELIVGAGEDAGTDIFDAETTRELTDDNPELAILIEELRSDYERQIQRAKSIGCPGDIYELDELSLSCETCFTTVFAACEKTKGAATDKSMIEAYVADRRECLAEERYYLGQGDGGEGYYMGVDYPGVDGYAELDI